MMRPILLSLALAVAGLALPRPRRPTPRRRRNAAIAAAAIRSAVSAAIPKEPIRIDANKLEVFDKEQRPSTAATLSRCAARPSRRLERDDHLLRKQARRTGRGRQARGAERQRCDAGRRAEAHRVQGPVTVVNGTQTLKADSMV